MPQRHRKLKLKLKLKLKRHFKAGRQGWISLISQAVDGALAWGLREAGEAESDALSPQKGGSECNARKVCNRSFPDGPGVVGWVFEPCPSAARTTAAVAGSGAAT